MRCLNCNKKTTKKFLYNIFCNKECLDKMIESNISFKKITINNKEQIYLTTKSITKFIVQGTNEFLEDFWSKYNTKKRTPKEHEIIIPMFEDLKQLILQHQMQLLLQLSEYLNFSLMNEKQLGKISTKEGGILKVE